MSTVVLSGVSKRYPKGGLAVDHFSLSVRDGEFLVLVGPSGCGKSTTLRMIAGLEEITEGTLEIGGRKMNGVAPKDRDIAMVFQNYALYPHMTVYGNMAFGLKLRRLPRGEIDARVRETAAALGLTDLLRRLPSQLSGGQRQRAALGRAIVRQPRVFLFDEPLSNLDAKMRVEMRAELRRLHRRLRATMIYVTHDQTEAMTMGDRIVVMDKGRIQQAAAPLDVYRRPANLFVAGFIGTPPMNRLEGRLARDAASGALRFESGGVRIPLPENDESPAWAAACAEGARVVAGFRPEALRPADAGHPAVWEGTADVVEPMGAETDVHLAPAAGGGARIIARLAPVPRITPGGRIALALDNAGISLFSAATGRRIGAKPGF